MPIFFTLVLAIFAFSLFVFSEHGLRVAALAGVRSASVYGGQVDGDDEICRTIWTNLVANALTPGRLGTVVIYNPISGLSDTGTCSSSGFTATTQSWPPDARNTGDTLDSIGVKVTYTVYAGLPPLGFPVPIDSSAVLRMEPEA